MYAYFPALYMSAFGWQTVEEAVCCTPEQTAAERFCEMLRPLHAFCW